MLGVLRRRTQHSQLGKSCARRVGEEEPLDDPRCSLSPAGTAVDSVEAAKDVRLGWVVVVAGEADRCGARPHVQVAHVPWRSGDLVDLRRELVLLGFLVCHRELLVTAGPGRPARPPARWWWNGLLGRDGARGMTGWPAWWSFPGSWPGHARWGVVRRASRGGTPTGGSAGTAGRWCGLRRLTPCPPSVGQWPWR